MSTAIHTVKNSTRRLTLPASAARWDAAGKVAEILAVIAIGVAGIFIVSGISAKAGAVNWWVPISAAVLAPILWGLALLFLRVSAKQTQAAETAYSQDVVSFKYAVDHFRLLTLRSAGLPRDIEDFLRTHFKAQRPNYDEPADAKHRPPISKDELLEPIYAQFNATRVAEVEDILLKYTLVDGTVAPES